MFSTATNDSPQLQTGLAYWMDEVLLQIDEASRELDPDPVHDLRVALRRCRSIAEGLRTIDPDPAWKCMRRAAKELFVPLGELRDVQVLIDWLKQLWTTDDCTTHQLSAFLHAREPELKSRASQALKDFNRKQWQLWAEYLAARTTEASLGRDVCEYLALERWHTALILHRRAQRDRTKLAFHQLRIGLKKFRYAVENFLPAQYERWGKDLKEVQDLLGEVHDLDVLWEVAIRSGVLAGVEERSQWRSRIVTERQVRLQAYRAKMAGRGSLWRAWRAELPSGRKLENAMTAGFTVLIRLLNAQPEHAERVSQLSLELYDGLSSCGLLKAAGAMPRVLLQTAALMHEIGWIKRKKGHHKASGRLISKMRTPVGWQLSDLHIAALVARYHRGALPQPGHHLYCELSPENQQLTRELAGVLRLADSLDRTCAGTVSKVVVRKTAETLPRVTLRMIATLRKLLPQGTSWKRPPAFPALSNRPDWLVGCSS
jgi:CHAD domain-containing protein